VDRPKITPAYRGPLDAIGPHVFPTVVRTGGVVTDPDEIRRIEQTIRRELERPTAWDRVRSACRRLVRAVRRNGDAA
jgi:hypothetical protein